MDGRMDGFDKLTYSGFIFVNKYLYIALINVIDGFAYFVAL